MRSGGVFVDIPASYALDRRGVWYTIETGIHSLPVPIEYGRAVC
jgi:hypothetical protein